jgi:LysR family transcriptional regulator, regulator for bpeEF and oprC
VTLDQLKAFVKVVDCGSFTRAAEVLGTQRTHISRLISQLESELRVTLLERTTRTQSITEAGREVYERAVGILGAVEDTVRVTQRVHDAPRGQLRITCGIEFGMVAVGSWLEEYLVRYPQMTVEAEYTSRELDLVHEGFDLAIRAGPLAESRLTVRLLGEFEYGLFASPQYSSVYGLPKKPEELAQHKLIVFTGGSLKPIWNLRDRDGHDPVKVQASARLRVNAGTGVQNAMLKGLGIGQLPTVIAHQFVVQGKLVPVLPRWRPPPTSVYAVYPSNRYLTPKVRAFVDLAILNFPGNKKNQRG